MKRVVYTNIHDKNSKMLELNIDVSYYRDTIQSSSILDINDPAFLDFESDILEACEIRDFELEDSYQSSSEGSVSQYYIYIKTNEDHSKLKVFLKIRISDHLPPSANIHGDIVDYDSRDEKYVKNRAKEFALEHYNQPRGYRARRINIIFNDDNFTSYEKALQAIEQRLDDFDPE